MKLKNLFFVFLAICFVCGGEMKAADGDTFVAQTAEGIDMTFKIISEANLTVQVGDGGTSASAVPSSYSGFVTIPSEVEYADSVYSVVSISNRAFYSNSKITDIIIPASVQSIGHYAFYHCTGLVSLTFEEGVKTFGEGAFNGCTKLKDVVLPEGLEVMSKGSFYNCTGLESIIIPSTVTTIGEVAFQNCGNLKHIYANMENPPTPGANAFTNLYQYCCLHVPAGTKQGYIDAGWAEDIFGGGILEADEEQKDGIVFTTPNEDGIDITYIITDADHKYVKVGDAGVESSAIATGTSGTVKVPLEVEYNGTTYIVNGLNQYAFYGCGSITKVELPNSITSIDTYAFGDCQKLEEVNMPEELISIGYAAFAYCYALKSVELPLTMRSISAYAFYGCTAMITLKLNEGLESIGNNAFAYCYALQSVDLPVSVKNFGNYIFWKCSAITSITLHEGLTVLKEGIFNQCTSLTKVVIPESVEVMEKGAFYSCSGLTSIQLPAKMKSIGDQAFESCTNLKSITLPDSLTAIGVNAFNGCYNLRHVYANMLEPFAFGTDAFTNIFSGCVCHVPEGTKEAYLAAGWTEGEDGVFAQVVEGEGEPTVGTEFTVTTVEGVELTLMIMSIGDNPTVQVGSGLKNDPCVEAETRGSVTIPATGEYNGQVFTVTAIGDRAFRYTKVDSVYVPETVGTVIQYAFANCDNLAYVSLPDSIKSLGMAAFYKCPNLKEIELPDSLEEIGGYAFSGSGLESVTLPAGVKTITRNAFSACPNLKWVVAEMPEPVAFGQSAFDGIDPECVLIVPQGTKAAYIEAGWNQTVFGGLVYESEPEYRHDVNKDGSVDINDVVAVINHMAGATLYPKSDTNGDDETNINDVVSIINFMAGR